APASSSTPTRSPSSTAPTRTSPTSTAPWCASWRRPRVRRTSPGFSPTWRSAMHRATSPAPSSRSPIRRSTVSTSATILSEHPIAARWRTLRAAGRRRAALIPYLTAGHPDPATSLAALQLVLASPLALIRLIAPTTTPERLTRAVRGASGFLYPISRLGVTGARDRVPPDLAEHVARVRAASPLPLAVGFGISTPAQASATAQLADGVVVGSALVDALGSGGLPAAERLIKDLAAAVRGNGT